MTCLHDLCNANVCMTILYISIPMLFTIKLTLPATSLETQDKVEVVRMPYTHIQTNPSTPTAHIYATSRK